MSRVALPIILILTLLSCAGIQSPVIFKKADYGDRWPFAVEEIEIYCSGKDKKEIYFRSNGQKYALNDAAIKVAENNTSTRAIKTYKEIWLDDPKNVGRKISIPSEFIEEGIKYCSKNIVSYSDSSVEDLNR